ncbi:MAG: Do family serine endopeptidase [Pelagibacteraceae bacterium]|nr:Do family serine endopeptidase [Pelagibacteraceae bacterium]
MNLSKMRILLFIPIIFFLFVSNLFANSAPESFADLVEELIPSVVSIASKTIIKEQHQQPLPRFPEGSPFDEFFKDFFDQEQRKSPSQRPMYGLGSGFIIDSAGIVVTNNHVIEGADEITIIMFDQEEYKAELLGRDPKGDLAVLKFDPSNRKISSVNWGNSDEVRVGDWSIAIGNPLGLGGTVTAGVVSAISRDIGNGPYVKFIQTDASINRGNSGGPLFNTKGEVIGINTAIISQSGGSIGLGFAIPSNSAKKITKQLKEFGRTIRGWLGVQITAVSKEIAESLGLLNEKGAFISNLNPDGPSKVAGLQEGDVILKFNNIEIIKMTDLPRLVAESDVGSTASVQIWRKNKIITVKVKLGELPEEAFVKRSKTNKNEKTYFVDSLNLTVAPNFEKNGVIVVETDDDSKLIPGDIIIEINRELFTTIDNFLELIDTISKTGRNSLLLKIIRDEKSLWITIKFNQ